jgi:hypothetical protein
VHDASVVEDDIQTTPLVNGLDHSLDLVLLGNIADLSPPSILLVANSLIPLEVRVGTHVWNDLDVLVETEDRGNSLVDLLLVDVGHYDVGSILGEEDRGLQSDSAGGARDDAVLVLEARH